MAGDFSHIEEAEIIEESLADSASDPALTRWLAEKVSNITKGSRGSVITEGLILAEFAEDPDALRKAYNDNRQALNDYFDQVDVEKVINETGVAKNIQSSLADRIKNNLPGFAVGSLAAAGVIAFLNHNSKRND